MLWKGLPLVCFGGGGTSKDVYMLIEDINRASNQQVFDFIGFIGAKKSDVSTELFVFYSVVTAANAGKVYFSKNSVAINYPEWLVFAKYSYT